MIVWAFSAPLSPRGEAVSRTLSGQQGVRGFGIGEPAGTCLVCATAMLLMRRPRVPASLPKSKGPLRRAAPCFTHQEGLLYSLDDSDPIEGLFSAAEELGAASSSCAPEMSDDWASDVPPVPALAAPESGAAELRSLAPPEGSGEPSEGLGRLFADVRRRAGLGRKLTLLAARLVSGLRRLAGLRRVWRHALLARERRGRLARLRRLGDVAGLIRQLGRIVYGKGCPDAKQQRDSDAYVLSYKFPAPTLRLACLVTRLWAKGRGEGSAALLRAFTLNLVIARLDRAI
jgi:hypothetical protein